MKTSSNIVKLKPEFMNDGVLRVGGRISRAPISPDAMDSMIHETMYTKEMDIVESSKYCPFSENSSG